MTGMFLQVSCSMMSVRRAYPDIEGRSTSVNIRSTLSEFPFSISQAFNPSATAATEKTHGKKKNISAEIKRNQVFSHVEEASNHLNQIFRQIDSL